MKIKVGGRSIGIGGRVGDALGGLVLGGPAGALIGGVAGDKLKDGWYSFSGRAARDAAEVAAAEARASAEARQKFIDDLVKNIRTDYGMGPDEKAVGEAQARINKSRGFVDGPMGGGGRLRNVPRSLVTPGLAGTHDYTLVAQAHKAKAAKEAIARDDAEYEGTFRDEADRQARSGYSQGLLNIRRRMAGQGLLGGSLDSGLHRRLMEGFVGERQRAVASARAARQQLEEGRFNTRMDLEKRAQAGDLINTRFDDIQRQTQTGITQANAKNMPQAFGEVMATFGQGVESYSSGQDRQRRRDAMKLPDDAGDTETLP